MLGKSAEYDPNYMDSIFNNWPNYKLKPNLTNVILDLSIIHQME
jgi:hypothetical protein